VLPGWGQSLLFPVQTLLELDVAGGGVAIMSLSETGDVSGVQVVAHGPTDGFAAAIEAAVPTWKFKITAPQGVSTAPCRADHMMVFSFIID
jgi:Na+-translocating ferredoxin:NAD+ oxidoreductase RnfG subunit